MPSSTPSPLDQLAGIEQDAAELRATRHAFLPESELFAHLTEVAERLDTLATLREVLTEWREAHVLWTAAMEGTGHLMPAARRMKAADEALMALLTPDSPRQAGEEITDGKD